MIVTSSLMCLALNIFNESGVEPMRGKRGVAMVTMNRVGNFAFPNDICSVVFDPHQFSWTNRGNLSPDGVDFEKNRLWLDSMRVAKGAINRKDGDDLTNGALYFNTVELGVRWQTDVVPQIFGNQIFY